MRLAWPEIGAREPIVPAHVVFAVGLELRARRRRRRAGRVAAACFASVAAAAAGIIAWTWVEHRQPIASRSGLGTEVEAVAGTSGRAAGSARAESLDEALWVTPGPAAAERQVVPGDMFRAAAATAGAGVELASNDGTEVIVEPGSALHVVEAGATKRFTLLQGAVRVRVRKLRAGERFLVDTSEAEVEVHGTRFRVTRTESTCSGAPSTGVSVSEGVVSVAGAGSKVRLLPGETWSSPCRAPGADAPQASAQASAPATSPAADRASADQAVAAVSAPGPRPDAERPRPLPRRHRAAPLSPSLLAAQNDLFASAARARRQGHAAQALTLFDRFVETYPDSSLLESALVQRMRLLFVGADRVVAAEAATRYLGRFPDGFARAEAEQILSAAGGPGLVPSNRAR